MDGSDQLLGEKWINMLSWRPDNCPAIIEAKMKFAAKKALKSKVLDVLIWGQGLIIPSKVEHRSDEKFWELLCLVVLEVVNSQTSRKHLEDNTKQYTYVQLIIPKIVMDCIQYLTLGFPENFFENIPNLNVLNISNTGITSLPRPITSLGNSLRLLNYISSGRLCYFATPEAHGPTSQKPKKCILAVHWDHINWLPNEVYSDQCGDGSSSVWSSPEFEKWKDRNGNGIYIAVGNNKIFRTLEPSSELWENIYLISINMSARPMNKETDNASLNATTTGEVQNIQSTGVHGKKTYANVKRTTYGRDVDTATLPTPGRQEDATSGMSKNQRRKQRKKDKENAIVENTEQEKVQASDGEHLQEINIVSDAQGEPIEIVDDEGQTSESQDQWVTTDAQNENQEVQQEPLNENQESITVAQNETLNEAQQDPKETEVQIPKDTHAENQEETQV
ncbi:hypothetical protein IFM89_000257 [Coptis chinensis]|uniref:Uncharacterized protein n=1 Tax=Coptis chinensis TaxID=261450 RepID=A0A835II00_9MAGN|nr:hypothetical protein IFM89_000257 [Coptis chinensis]